ncbi:hypothetical protein [Tahibacter caeni]|uniref:hypothetical protein n=1 Tax=Tahibacter caeni TaxID=1453545 RepID=UPI002147DBC0|nr:hypothetical protein [Tahibacter caeni]
MLVSQAHFFVGENDAVKRLRLHRDAGQWRLDGTVLQNGTHGPLGRVEIYDDRGVLAFAAEGLRTGAAKIAITGTAAARKLAATIALPVFFNDGEGLVTATFDLSAAGGVVRFANRDPGDKVDPRPRVFRLPGGLDPPSRLMLDRDGEWKCELVSDPAPADDADGNDRVRTPTLSWHRIAPKGTMSDLLRLRGVDLGERADPLANEAGDIRLANSSNGPPATLSQQLAPSRRVALDVEQYLGETAWRIVVGPVSTADFCAVWTESLYRPLVDGLVRARGAALTFLPSLAPRGDAKRAAAGLSFAFVFKAALGRDAPDHRDVAHARLAGFEPLPSLANEERLSATILAGAGGAGTLPAKLAGTSSRLVFSLSYDAPRRIDLGALSLQVVGADVDAPPLPIRVALRSALAAGVVLERREAPPLDLSVDIEELALSHVRPGATDGVPDAARARTEPPLMLQPEEKALIRNARGADDGTLVVPLGTATGERRAWLRAAERYKPFRQRALSLEIRSAGDAAPQSVAVLDGAPLFVGKIADIQLEPAEGMEEIANYAESELDGSKWEIAGIRSSFDLRLPPQAVGENAEKGSRFAPAIAAGRPIDYRYAAPAKLLLKSSWFDQRFNEAPWNVRRVFGYAGQRAPGASVVSLDFELVYGLSTSFDATALPYRTQLAELGSRVGAPPPELRLDRLPQNDRRRGIVLDAAIELIGLRRRYDSRLAQLELYNPAERSQASGGRAAATADLQLDRGLHFELRPTAAMEHPFEPGRHWSGTGPGGGFLRGGALWAFESRTVYDEVVKVPDSRQGSVDRLRFSALGGYGEQRAVFADGKSIVSVRTEMGRLSSYVLERKGRIAGYWNRARHVIVYERTVLPSRQFRDDQPPHRGRPLLRKVSEYVEILEPRRSTRRPGQTALGARCVESIDFKSVVIPVDGAWGSDIEGGWVIPLWNPDADPEVYPRPTICPVFSGSEEETGSAPPISEPQRLRFYTSTRPGDGEDTEQWDPVERVDTRDVPLEAPGAPVEGRIGPADYLADDETLPAEAGEPLGMYYFTFPLDPQSRPANLVAGTQAARIAARLDNVTLVRGAAVVGGRDGGATLLGAISRGNDDFVRIANGARALAGLSDPDQRRDRVRALKDRLGTTSKALHDQLDATDQWLDAQRSQAGSLLRDTRRRVRDGLRSAVARELDDVRRALQTYRDEAVRFSASICRLERGEARQRAERWIDELQLIATGLAALPDDARRLLAREVDATAGRASELVDRARRDVETQADTLLAIVGDAATSWNVRRERLRAALPRVRQVRAEALATLATFVERLPHGAIAALLGDLAARARKMEAALGALENGLDHRLANAATPEAEIRAAIVALKQEVRALADDLVRPVDAVRGEIQMRIGELTFGASPLPQWPAAVRRNVLAVIDGVFDTAEDRCQVLGTRMRERFDAFLQWFDAGVAALAGKLEQAAAAFDALIAPVDDLHQRLGDAIDDSRAELDALLTRLETATGDAAERLAGQIATFTAPLRSAFDDVDRVLDRVRQAPSFRKPEETLRLVRALGEGPLLPNMTINRDRLAYVFDDYAAAIRSSPAAALVDRVGSDLKALGLRVPFDGLADVLVPPALRDFDLNRLLPSFAGLRNLEGLFAGLKMPDLSERGIRISHGFDKERQSAWLQGDIDVRLDRRVDVFSLAGLALGLDEGHLTGQSRVVATLDGLRDESTWGEIRGDWLLTFGGYTLVRFVDTPLRFDQSGSLRFDVDARKIVLDRALRWLEDVVKQFSDPDSGFTLALLKGDDGTPRGVRASLELPLPPQGAGAVTVAGIILSAFFELDIAKEPPRGGEPGFAISAGFGLGKPEMPFSLFIAFLGGGGFLSGKASYWPALKHDNFSAEVELGLSAGAAAAFFFGPVRGHAMVLVGLRARYVVIGKGGQLTAAVTLLITGSASLYGLVTIGLTLYLQLIYGADKSLRGDGYISVSVRISRFFKVSYSAPIRYQIAKGDGGGKNAADAYQLNADRRRKSRC